MESETSEIGDYLRLVFMILGIPAIGIWLAYNGFILLLALWFFAVVLWKPGIPLKEQWPLRQELLFLLCFLFALALYALINYA